MRSIAHDVTVGPAALAEAELVRRTVRAVHRHFEKSIQARATEVGFTLPQVRLLRQVVAHPGITVTRLADVLAISQSTASGIVARLAAKGILEKRPDASDGRSSGLWPTAPVDAFMAGDRSEFVNGPVVELLRKLAPEDRSAVLTAMRALAEQLEPNPEDGHARR